MAGKEIALGPIGRALIDNLIRLRGQTTYAELSRRMEKAGRPIPSLGLRRIEAGERRVDVDDLVALALVLGVSPLALLLPQGEQTDTSDVGGREVRNDALWQWSIGHVPLDGSNPRQFQANSLPPWLRVQTMTETVGRDPIPAGEFNDWWEGNPPRGND